MMSTPQMDSMGAQFTRAPVMLQYAFANLCIKFCLEFCVGIGKDALLFCLSIAPISHSLRETKGVSVSYLDHPVLYG